jgi:hypothetical protein
MSLGLLDNSLPTPSDISEAVIRGFLTISVFYRDEVVSLMPQPPPWRARVSSLTNLLRYNNRKRQFDKQSYLNVVYLMNIQDINN